MSIDVNDNWYKDNAEWQLSRNLNMKIYFQDQFQQMWPYIDTLSLTQLRVCNANREEQFGYLT